MSNKKGNSIINADMAWCSNERPSEIVFNDDVDENIAKVILFEISKSPLKGEIIEKVSLKALKPIIDPAGHFCLDNVERKWFIRVNRRKRKSQEMENSVISYLFNCGIRVVKPIISDISINWAGHRYQMSVFPLIKGRHFNGSDSDLVSLSETLSQVHTALKLFRLANTVYLAALKTAEHLAKAKDIVIYFVKTRDSSQFFESGRWAERNFDWLREMAQRFNPYLCLLPQSQCIHGELHIGNVIFSLDDGSATIIDYEEAYDAWFPPSFDLAYIVHRFCMDGNPSRELFSKRLKIIETCYGKLPCDLKEMMRQVCWYNIALLINRSVRRESISPEEEYEKFVSLEKLTNIML